MTTPPNPAPSLEQVAGALTRIPADRLPLVLQFIEFIEYQDLMTADDDTEDDALWAAVGVNVRHKQTHPDEPLVEYASGDAFLAESNDL